MQNLPPNRLADRFTLVWLFCLALSAGVQAESGAPPNTRVWKDLAYVKDGHERQRLDLYVPKGEGRHPLIISIHGGAFRMGSKADGVPWDCLAQGYAVASINYRLSQHAAFPAQIQDCKAAVRWLRAHAEDYGLASEHFAAMGSSAGGHLSAMLGTTGQTREFDVGENLNQSSAVQAVVDYFGPTDFLQMDGHRPVGGMVHDAADSPESQLVGGPIQERKAQVARANPITFISAEAPPFLIVHGDADPLVPHHQSVLLEAALRKAGRPVVFYTVSGAGHGGFSDPKVATLTREFLAAHLRGAPGARVRSTAADARKTGEVLAFPGAEGFGRWARGGRGGDVYHVTNLDDAGPGSLREGFRSATGPRTIVFDVSGTIELKKKLVLDKSCITVAGQTAPGDGITLKEFTFQIVRATNVVVRYLRMRLGDEHKGVGAKGGDDTLNTEDIDQVILDHCSLSWAIDGTHDLRRGGNFTMQWCIVSEALNRSLHGKGEHAMAASYRDLSGNITLHHNLFATCRDRHPTLGSAQKPPAYVVDFRNNVIYNWSAGGTVNFCDHFINCISNHWRPGPMTDVSRLPIAMKGNLPDLGRGYMQGNVFAGRDDLTRDNYAALDFQRWLKPPSKYLFRGSLNDWKAAAAPELGANRPRTETAEQACESVMDRAGASLHRDAVDDRLIADVRAGRGKLIDSPGEVGGWPALRSAPPPLDTDRDGMPDAWERGQGLDPRNPDDRNGDRDGDGFTNLEEYLQSLCRG